ncbi:hypothetical protein [Psychrobacter pygoscelis]|uniref:hypothetical protein n=1 Tax=Psychrobacter pygoscelis TaxID=2488563 RepID=UPI001039F8D9|nr:hypothetical protein [Psychrobacter pygoscelis]
MIKWFDSKLMGNKIPVITNTQGDLVKMLNAILVDGCNSQPVTSISYSDGICTLTLQNGHGFLIDSVVDVVGSTQAGLQDKEFRVTSVSTTTISFKSDSVVDEQGLSVRYAPLGWTQHFASEGRTCYQSSDPRYPAFLRVDDTKLEGTSASAAKFATVEICANMTSFDNADWQSPYNSSYPEQNRETISGRSNGWFKWYYASPYSTSPDRGSTTNPDGVRDYIIVGNKSSFWLISYPYADVTNNNLGAVLGVPLVDFGVQKFQTLVARSGFGIGSQIGYPHFTFAESDNNSSAPYLKNYGRVFATHLVSYTEHYLTDILLQSPIYQGDSSGPVSGVFEGVGIVPFADNMKLSSHIVKHQSARYKIVNIGQPYQLAFSLGDV